MKIKIKRRCRSVLCVGLSCAVLLAGCKSENGRDIVYTNGSVSQVAEARLPVMATYPSDEGFYDENGEMTENAENWTEQQKDRRQAARELKKYGDSFKSFYGETIGAFLNDGEDINAVYSPVNLYFALAMSAEITEGESREQLLRLLGAKDIDALRGQTDRLWTACYRNDGAVTSILANSLWLNENIEFKKAATDRLAENYFASVFSGDPGSQNMTEALRAWLNEQTGGLLKESVKNAKLDPMTVAALCSTVYFRAKWDQVFLKENNDSKIFHGLGGDVEREFMNTTFTYGPYYYGEDFGAVRMRFAEGGGMWLILPDEEKSLGDVLEAGEYLDMVTSPDLWENSTSIKVNCSVPKFDVSSEMGLMGGLKRLGVTDIFDMGKADFSPLTEDTEVYFSDARHAARVVIDEEGCTAAAYTEMLAAGAALPPEDEVDFVVDRPFLFVITGESGEILFAGTVYEL